MIDKLNIQLKREYLATGYLKIVMSRMWILVAMILMSVSCSQKDAQTDHNHNTPVTETGSISGLMLTDSQIALANIQIQKAEVRNIQEPRIINARVATNTSFSEVISSRVAGRIERLYVKETGKPVKQGQPLYEIYSEYLLTLQEEYLLAHTQANAVRNQNHYKAIETAARKKLILYGLTEVQVDKLATTGKKEPRLTFVAPTSGIVKTIGAQEGQLVSEGSKLYEIENLEKLRIEAELFANEADLVKAGDKLKVKVDGFEILNMEVKFLNPEFKAGQQTWLLWGDVKNPGGLKPGMPAQVWIDQHKNGSITLPVQAVIRSEDGTHVYIESDKNSFQPRMVKTGMENFSEVEILEGLQPGERVVVSGAYLLYSEYILKYGVNPAHAHNSKTLNP
ncbi:MAG: hypothetical protein BroJett042_29320 [Bacteroidota bacterium]|nr:MAG: hypothetical protein BroJett042_29320 [Bacteroidota bacterium]